MISKLFLTMALSIISANSMNFLLSRTSRLLLSVTFDNKAFAVSLNPPILFSFSKNKELDGRDIKLSMPSSVE